MIHKASDVAYIQTADALEFCDSINENLVGKRPILDCTYGIAGLGIRHSIYGDESLVDFMHPALKHLRNDDLSPGTYHIISIDGGAVDFQLPKPFWSWNSIDNQGYVLGLDAQRFTVHYDAVTMSFRMLDRVQKMAYHWVRDMDSLPYWERSFPLRAMINWIARDTSLQPIHAAAVGTEHGAVLLTAKGGSGKSTTALNCLLAGMDYLGDDFIIADCESLTAYSLYNVVKLLPDDLNRFPMFRPYFDPHTDDQEKTQVFLHDHFPEKLKSQMPIRKVLVPRISGHGPDSSFSPISREETLAALTASTFYLLRGKNNEAYRKIANLIEKVPCMYLNLGSDLQRVPVAIQELLQAE